MKEVMMKKSIWFSLCALMMALGPQIGGAQENSSRLIEEFSVAFNVNKIDWEERYYYASAIGAYDPAASIAGSVENLSYQVARRLARRRLLEMAMGMRVSAYGQTIVNQTGPHHFAAARIISYGFLKGAEEVDHGEIPMPSGPPAYYVTLKMPMISFERVLEIARRPDDVVNSLQAVVTSLGISQEDLKAAVGSLSPNYKRILDGDSRGTALRVQPTAVSEPFTGLIVDARHLPEAGPAILGRILTPSLRRVYGHEDVSMTVELNGAMVNYARSEDRARNIRIRNRQTNQVELLLGPNPYPVRAIKTRPGRPSHLIIPEGDGQRIVGAGGESFLREARVVFLID